MKLLFSADYHIKLKTKNIPEDWAKSRFRQLFTELALLEQNVDLHIMGGDFFDKMPTLEELELYYEFVASRQCPTYIIPGNHEALKKDTTFFSYLKNITNRLNDKVEVMDEMHGGIFDIIPYNRLKKFEKEGWPFEAKGNILITHVRGEIPPHVKPEIDLTLFDGWQTVLAGDLHSYDNCQRNILYPGSPLTTSFHRSNVDTGVIILDTATMDHEFVKLGLPQLIRKTIQAGEPMPATCPDHTIYEVEGDMSELADVLDHELMDKKVVKRNVDTALILHPEMTIEEEMIEYLAYVLQLPQETINAVLGEYYNCLKDAKMV